MNWTQSYKTTITRYLFEKEFCGKHFFGRNLLNKVVLTLTVFY